MEKERRKEGGSKKKETEKYEKEVTRQGMEKGRRKEGERNMENETAMELNGGKRKGTEWEEGNGRW